MAFQDAPESRPFAPSWRTIVGVSDVSALSATLCIRHTKAGSRRRRPLAGCAEGRDLCAGRRPNGLEDLHLGLSSREDMIAAMLGEHGDFAHRLVRDREGESKEGV